jgi:dihydrofolate reductase
MKTQYFTASSVDGYLADDQHSLDWLFQFGQVKSMQDDYPRFIREVGAIAMGSATYEWIVRQEQLLDNPQKWPY